MIRGVFALASLCLACVLGCSGNSVHFTPPPPAADDNALGPGDVFGVRVFGEAELSQDYRVAPDGTIDFPYVGRVHVQGMTPTETADALRQQLHDRQILVNPQVSVIIREFNSRRINILGQVAHPGTFPFEQNMTIVQAVSLAGGFTALANQRSVRLTRRLRRSGTQSYEIPVDLIATGRASNVYLAPGDTIFVPENPF